MENKTPLGDLLADARQKLEGIAEPGAEPLELVEEPEDQELQVILNEGQNQTFLNLARLALGNPNLLPVVAAELLHQQRHPGADLATTENQLNRRIDAVRALKDKPKELQALDRLTKGLVSFILMSTAQMTHQQPLIKIVHDLPSLPEA